MIISFEAARQERPGALPIHDTRIYPILLSTNQEFDFNPGRETRWRLKHRGFFERPTLLGTLHSDGSGSRVLEPYSSAQDCGVRISGTGLDEPALRLVLRRRESLSHTIVRFRRQSLCLDVSWMGGQDGSRIRISHGISSQKPKIPAKGTGIATADHELFSCSRTAA